MARKKKLGLILGICIPCAALLNVGLPFALFMIWLHTPFSYKGERVDLYTTAVCNIYGIEGMSHNGETYYQPQIDVIDSDSNGRVLFTYQEYHNWTGPYYRGGLVIMQKSDKERAYYFDNCYLPIYAIGYEKVDITTYFEDEQISLFKSENDWDKPLGDSFMSSTFVKRQPSDGQLGINRYDVKNAFQEYANVNYDKKTVGVNVFYCCQKDRDGRELFYAHPFFEDIGWQDDCPIVAMIFETDKTCPVDHISVIENIDDSELTISNLKQLIGWSN